MKYSLNMGGEAGFEMGAVKFTIKDAVVLVRPTSVAEVVGRVYSETVGEDRTSEASLECSLWSTDYSCSMLLTTRAWTLSFSRIVDL